MATFKITVTEWAWQNCVWCKLPNGGLNTFVDWGHTYIEHDTFDEVQRYFLGEIVSETEKAVCFKVNAHFVTRYGNNIYKTIEWKLWIPKSQLIDTENGMVRTFHEYSSCVDAMVVKARQSGKKVKGWD